MTYDAKYFELRDYSCDRNSKRVAVIFMQDKYAGFFWLGSKNDLQDGDILRPI